MTPEQALRDYAWSSYAEYLKPPTRRWPWLRVERLLGEMRLPKDSAAGRLVREELAKLGWSEEELGCGRRGVSVKLVIQTTAGFSYVVGTAEDLSSPFWTQVGASLTATTNTLKVTDSILGEAQRFYRVRRSP